MNFLLNCNLWLFAVLVVSSALKFKVGPENFEKLQDRVIQQAQGLYGLDDWKITTSVMFSKGTEMIKEENYDGAVSEGEVAEPSDFELFAYALIFESGTKKIACFQPALRANLTEGIWHKGALEIFNAGNLADIEEDGGAAHVRTTGLLKDPRPMPWLNPSIGTCFRTPVLDDDFTFPLIDFDGMEAYEKAKKEADAFIEGSSQPGQFPWNEYCGEGKSDEDCYKGFHRYLTTHNETDYHNTGWNDYADANHPNTEQCQKRGKGCSAAFTHLYRMMGADLRFPDKIKDQVNPQGKCTRFANKAIRAFGHDMFMATRITGRLLDTLNMPINDGLCEYGRYVKDLAETTGCDEAGIIQMAAYLGMLRCGFNLNMEAPEIRGLLFWNIKKVESCFEMPDFKNVSSTNGLGHFAKRYFGDRNNFSGDGLSTDAFSAMMRAFHQQGQVKCPPPGHRAGPFFPRSDNLPAFTYQSQQDLGNETLFDLQCRFVKGPADEQVTDARPEAAFCSETLIKPDPETNATESRLVIDAVLERARKPNQHLFWWPHIISRRSRSTQNIEDPCPFPLVSTLHKEIYLARNKEPEVDIDGLGHYLDVADDEEYWDKCGICDFAPKENKCVNNEMVYDPEIDQGRERIPSPTDFPGYNLEEPYYTSHGNHPTPGSENVKNESSTDDFEAEESSHPSDADGSDKRPDKTSSLSEETDSEKDPDEASSPSDASELNKDPDDASGNSDETERRMGRGEDAGTGNKMASDGHVADKGSDASRKVKARKCIRV